MRGRLGRALVLGVLTGIRSTAGLVALTRSASIPDGSVFTADPFRRLVRGALAGETLADKSGLLPSRTDPIPWAGRALLGGATAFLAASWYGSSRSAAVVMGAVSAAATTWLATSTRSAARARGVPDLITALGEDLIVVRLVRALDPPHEEVG